jgi:uncharacterized protein
MTTPHQPPADASGEIRHEERVGIGDGHAISFLRFGAADARPKVYIQAGLHADELPGMLVARLLAEKLASHADRGGMIGQVVLAPSVNPIGLSQTVGDMLSGRAELATGRNFNRHFPDLAAAVTKKLAGKLDADASENTALIRAATAKALKKQEPADAFGAMQLAMLRQSHDADIVLDLHADNQALIHLYCLPQLWPAFQDLAAEIDARAILLCEDSGASTFDEAVGTPWLRLAAAFPEADVPLACQAACVELRSNDAVDERLAERDANALFRFLQRRGVVAGEAGSLPRLLGTATDLTAMQQLKAPVAGLVVYRAQLGDTVRAGEVIAEIVPLDGPRVSVCAETDGLLFARHSQPWAWPGRIIGKIAGQTALPDRVGDLLSP